MQEVVKQLAANPGQPIDYDEVQRRFEAGLQAKVDSIVQTQETTTTEIQLQKEAV
jgi:hypothetical protein